MNFCDLIALIVIFQHGNAAKQSKSNSIRQPRNLVFPPTTPTRLQFICGIGIPVEELRYESVTSGYVLKAEYFLPTNVTELQKNYLKPQNIEKRQFLDGYNSEDNYGKQSISYKAKAPNRTTTKQGMIRFYRWIVYSALEQMTIQKHSVGRVCVLRSICETARVPFHNAGGILSEIVHIILTPSSSLDINHHNDNKEYSQAEIQGRASAECASLYNQCPESFFKRLTYIFTTPLTALKPMRAKGKNQTQNQQKKVLNKKYFK